jgi:hypothetical protein
METGMEITLNAVLGKSLHILIVMNYRKCVNIAIELQKKLKIIVAKIASNLISHMDIVNILGWINHGTTITRR